MKSRVASASFILGAIATGFTAPPAPSVPGVRTLRVTADGSARFHTVQAAINALPQNGPPAIIRIMPGIYKERILLDAAHPHVTFRGEGQGAASKTILTYDLSARSAGQDGNPVGTGGSASVDLQADDFTATDITFENSAGPGTKVGQAVAIKVTGDRCVFLRCRFLGWQDTLYASSARPTGGSTGFHPRPGAAPIIKLGARGGAPNGEMPGANRLCRQYYRECTIAGNVDFIFGSARAVFDRCIIRSRGSGAITAHARTTPNQPGGYVFQNCKLTSDPGVPPGSVVLGRPWRPYARVVYLHCWMGPQVAPRGWDNWRDPLREKTAFYAESHCAGPGADRARRVDWERTLSPAGLAEFASARFLAGSDGWRPTLVK